MAWAVDWTTSAARRTGGIGLTVEPTVLASGSAVVSQLRMVLGQTRKARAVSWAFHPRKPRISRMRKRWPGE
jgi:hypothetical protein